MVVWRRAFECHRPEIDRPTAAAGQEKYDIGSGFGHFALGVPDVATTVASIKAAGGVLGFRVWGCSGGVPVLHPHITYSWN